MATLFNPSKKTFTGPWLLDIQSLEELDTIVEYADASLKKSRQDFIELEAQKAFEEKEFDTLEKARKSKIESYKNTVRKDITLISHDESKLTDKSIKEILVDPKIKNFKPKDLSIDIEYGLELENGRKNKFSLDVKQRYDGELEYKIEATQSEIEDELNYKLENWIDKNKPLIVKALWLRYSFLLMMFGGLISLISYSFISSTYVPSSKYVYKDKIENIIKTGVNESNQAQAIELLLKINTGYLPEDIKPEKRINRTAKSISVFSFAIFLIGIFKPKTLIGVGKHKNLLKIYKRYMQLVLFIIPGIFVYPYIIDFIKNLV